jgi:arabinan endo-1,5-alpha-L-arabinosidase
MLKNTDIHIRDPFVLPVPGERRYYLYGTQCYDRQYRTSPGFDCYVGFDLENWEGPFPAFRPPAGFWADRNFWAPEVYPYGERYYMFASFKAPGVCRGTQILVSNSPCGPFFPHSDGPVTPCQWECLDGTFYLDAQGDPWIVFCHEWVQTVDGEICALRLSPDLKTALGEPELLFRASQASWVRPLTADWEGQKRTGYVTDGPFLFQDGGGELCMLWSSYSRKGYTLSVAHSPSGGLRGPWQQEADPMDTGDGGHAMLFRTFAGERMLSLHQPNRWPNELPMFLPWQTFLK